MTSMADYTTELDALLDDGYSLEEARDLLGLQPVPVAPAVGISPMPAGWSPSWDARAVSAPTAPTPALEKVVKARDRAQAVQDSRGKPAPVAAKVLKSSGQYESRVQLSFGAKVERIAKAMAQLRGLSWIQMSPKQQDGFYVLAEFALQAIEKVEEDEVALKRRYGKKLATD